MKLTLMQQQYEDMIKTNYALEKELTRLKELNREMVEAFIQLLELRGNKSRGAFSLTVTMEKWETAWDKMKKIVSKASEVER